MEPCIALYNYADIALLFLRHTGGNLPFHLALHKK